MRTPIKALSSFLLICLLSIFAESSHGAEGADIHESVATTELYGKKIHLYPTEFPGQFVDQDMRSWIFIPNPESLLAEVERIRRNDPGEWSTRGKFKLYSEASLEEIKIANQLNPTGVQNVMIDARGDSWVFFKDPKNPNKMKDGHFVRLESLPLNTVVTIFGGSFNMVDAFKQANRAYLPDQAKFSSALLLVSMAKCFGGGIADFSFQVGANRYSPTCVDDFIAMLLDPAGWASFYFFVLANRATNPALTKIILLITGHVGNKSAIPIVRMKIAPYLGYVGMTMGSLASTIAHNFFAAPSWGQCFELFSQEGFTSLPCREAYTHFISENFWVDFGGETLTMLGSMAASQVTQLIAMKAARAGVEKWTTGLLAKNLGVVSTSRAETTAALELIAKFGVRGVKAVQTVRGLVGLAGGPPGMAFVVVTEVGSFVMFLAWNEILRGPVMSEYHSQVDSGQVNQAIKMIDDSLEKTKALNWEKPYLLQECRDVVDTTTIIGGQDYLNPESFKIEMDKPWQSPSYAGPDTLPPTKPSVIYTYKKECKWISPLEEGLNKLKDAAQKYRQQVLQVNLDTASHGWKQKTSSYMDRYRAGKVIMEYLYAQKDKKLTTNMDVFLTSTFYAADWIDAMEKEIPFDNNFKTNMMNQFAEMRPLMEILGEIATLEANDSLMAQAKAMYLGVLLKFKDMFRTNARVQLKNLLMQNQLFVKNNFGGASRDDRPEMQILGGGLLDCRMTPDICSVEKKYRDFRFDQLDTDLESHFITQDNQDVVDYLVGTFGSKTINSVFFDLFCSDNDTYSTSNVADTGRAGQFNLPFILDMSMDERREFQKANCTNAQGDLDYYFREDDYKKTWFHNGRTYPDPLSIAIDSQVKLSTGSTAAEAQKIWKEKAFPPTMEFIIHAVTRYRQVLEESYLPLIPDMSAADLVHIAQPQMRGPELDHKIVSYINFNEGARPSMAQSLMAQVNYALDLIKYNVPAEKEIARRGKKYRVNLKNAKLDRLIKRVKLDMASTILAFRGITPQSDVEQKVRLIREDLAHLYLTDDENLVLGLHDIDSQLGTVIIPKAAKDDDHNAIVANILLLEKSSSELYHYLTGVQFDDMRSERERYKAGLSAEEIGKLSKKEYKKYIFFKLIHENVNDIVINYLTLDIYKKLSLQPLMEINNQE